MNSLSIGTQDAWMGTTMEVDPYQRSPRSLEVSRFPTREGGCSGTSYDSERGIDVRRFLSDRLKEVSEARNKVFAHLKRNRPLGKDYEDVGLAGEWEFGRFSGLFPKTKPGGDGGVDFELPVVFTVDVKTSRKGDYLLVEEGKVKADIYVLAKYQDEGGGVALEPEEVWNSGKATLVGWCFALQLKAYQPRDTGRGVINHAVPADALRPMDELKKMMGKVKRA